MKKFASCELLEKEIERDFNNFLLKLKIGKYYDTKKK